MKILLSPRHSDHGSIRPGDNQLYITRRQQSFLISLGTLVAIIVSTQSYWILPAKFTDLKERVYTGEAKIDKRMDTLDKDNRDNKDLLIELRSQLVAARDEIRMFRTELQAAREDSRRKP